MKLIVWGLALLTILPLLYLGGGKKGGQLILGVIIVAILIASYCIPEEVIFSLTQNEIEKEVRSKIKKIDELIHEASKQESNPEKAKEAKKIIDLEKEKKELEKELEKLSREGKQLTIEFEFNKIAYLRKIFAINSSKNEGVVNWSKEISSSAILFCGEEFNQTLTTKEYKIEGKDVKISENIIDFADYQEKTEEEIREKILEIIKKEESREFSVVFFKNINKIIKTEIKELLSTLLGQGANASFWTYKQNSPQGSEEEAIPNLSKFVFVASSSSSDFKELENLHKNFRIVEVPLSRNQLVIFILLGGIEIIIFFFLIKSKRKSQHEKLKQLD